VSKLGVERGDDPTKHFKEGDAIQVVYNGTDDKGRMNFAKAK
jgi:hypothetical protein